MKQKQQNTGIMATAKDFHVKKRTELRLSGKQQKHKPAKVGSIAGSLARLVRLVWFVGGLGIYQLMKVKEQLAKTPARSA